MMRKSFVLFGVLATSLTSCIGISEPASTLDDASSEMSSPYVPSDPMAKKYLEMFQTSPCRDWYVAVWPDSECYARGAVFETTSSIPVYRDRLEESLKAISVPFSDLKELVAFPKARGDFFATYFMDFERGKLAWNPYPDYIFDYNPSFWTDICRELDFSTTPYYIKSRWTGETEPFLVNSFVMETDDPVWEKILKNMEYNSDSFPYNIFLWKDSNGEARACMSWSGRSSPYTPDMIALDQSEKPVSLKDLRTFLYRKVYYIDNPWLRIVGYPAATQEEVNYYSTIFFLEDPDFWTEVCFSLNLIRMPTWLYEYRDYGILPERK